MEETEVLNCCCFFQRTVFGEFGHFGHLVQNLVGEEPLLDLVTRLGMNKTVEIVQDPEETANLAIHNLVLNLQPPQPQLNLKQRVFFKDFQNTYSITTKKEFSLFICFVTFKILTRIL